MAEEKQNKFEIKKNGKKQNETAVSVLITSKENQFHFLPVSDDSLVQNKMFTKIKHLLLLLLLHGYSYTHNLPAPDAPSC